MNSETTTDTQFESSKRGTIYFIREGDFSGNPVSDFVKIGLTGLDRTAAERVKDIMTGNPRELYVHYSLAVPFAQDIETAMRYEFLFELANLEWHHFPKGAGRQLDEAIEYCQKISEEFAQFEKIYLEAKRLEEVLPSRDMIPTSSVAQLWSDSYVLHHHVAKRAKDATAKKRESAKAIVKQGGEAPEGTKVTDQVRAHINYEKFEAENGELADKYRKKKWGGTLNVFAVRGAMDMEKLNRSPVFMRVTDEVVKFEAIMERESQDPSEDLYSESYRQLLVIQQIAKHSEFRKKVADWNLKVLCGESLGIDGICEWDRVVSMVRDTERLKKEQMDVLNSYRKASTKIVRTDIEKASKGKQRG